MLHDVEDRKILSRKRKRVGKVEEVYFDLDQFFAQKKRFKPSSPSVDTEESERIAKINVDVDKIKGKLVANYLAELPEQKYTQEQTINYLKYLIKDVQYKNFSRSEQEKAG